MKAILVLDEMPKSCDKCPCYHEGYGHCNNVKFRFIQDSDKVAPWCPLKPMPEKKPVSYHDDLFGDVEKNFNNIGWNACLEEIER